MNELATIRELFDYDDWAMQRVLAPSAELDDAQLDRQFEMGFGSLRRTLVHTYGTELAWLGRCIDGVKADIKGIDNAAPIAKQQDQWREVRERWSNFLAGLKGDAALQGNIDYKDMKGVAHSSRLLDIILHVVNHGVYHRSQALNMLRHLDHEPPRIDYIFMHFESPREEAPKMSREVVQYYFKCTDWLRNRVLDACANLSDEQLDREFEMGPGSIRATLAHTEDAERWWLLNWTNQSPGEFPKPDKWVTVAQLRSQFERTAAKRNEFIAALHSDDELGTPVETQPAPERVYTFWHYIRHRFERDAGPHEHDEQRRNDAEPLAYETRGFRGVRV
jgi:uncharacterized damage-inducible protein DinB